MQEIQIRTEYITTGQLLKLSGLVGSGSEAKMFILDGQVLVNGEVDTRRGRKLYPNDIVSFQERTFKIVK